jgi:hypothetical protein
MNQTTRWITKIPLLNSASPFWRALVLLLFGCACFAFWGAVQPSSLNRIQRENRQPGTTAWQLTEFPLPRYGGPVAAGQPAPPAAASQHGAAILGGHAGEETVRFGAVSVIRLKSTFRHLDYPARR